MAGRRVHFVMDPGLVDRIDAACPEGVSRGEFVRRAVEAALSESQEPYVFEAERQAVREAVEAGATKARVEMGSALPERRTVPEPDPDRRRPLARSSSLAKRDVRPVPKGER